MKHATLLQHTPPGSEAEYQMVGGATVRGRVLEISQDLITLQDGPQRRTFFVDSIVGFSLPTVPAHSSAPAAENRREAEASAVTALERRDQIEQSLREPGGVGAATRIAVEFAAEVKAKPEPARSDGNLRYAVVQAFKLLEYHRKLAATNPQRQAEAAQLSRGLLALNEALRAAKQVTEEDRFSDLYHFLVAVRRHEEEFRRDANLFANLRDALEEASKLGDGLLANPIVLASWERQPFRRKTHYYRLSEVARYRIAQGFVAEREAADLREKAEHHALLSDRATKIVRNATPTMGRIASFGNGRFGFIQTRELQTLYFNLQDVISTETMTMLREQSGSDIEVDFDIVPAEGNGKYERAVRVRSPGSSAGLIARLFTSRNFGYIELYDGRAVHFWLQALAEPDLLPVEGTPVICWAVKTEKGWTTNRVEAYAKQPEAPPPRASVKFLKAAQEARNANNNDDAVRILEEGLRKDPDPQMFLNLAAIMKEIAPERALRVYERGLDEFGEQSYKLHHDTGVWLEKLERYGESAEHLEVALRLTREDSERRGLKGVLLALGRTLYAWRTPDAVRQAHEYYREAAELWGGEAIMRSRLPKRDLDCLDGVQAEMLRLEPDEGAAFEFLRTAGLAIEKLRCNLSGQITDIVCKVDPQLAADFGLEQRIFLRYLPVKTAVEVDSRAIEEAAAKAADEWETGGAVAFLLLDAVPAELKDRLGGRLEPTEETERPLVIVPISRPDLETHRDPRQALRAILGGFLGKRDLFLRKGKVSGIDFFGRTAIESEINGRLLRNGLHGLFGLRRIGKTSVLDRVRRTQVSEGNIVLFQDLLKIKGSSDPLGDIYYSFAHQLREQCESRPGGSADAFLPEDFHWDLADRYVSLVEARRHVPLRDAFLSDLERVLRRLESLPEHGRPRVILVTDEIEGLKPLGQNNYGDAAVAYFSTLRGLYQTYPRTFSAVFTAANPSVAEIPRFRGMDNPLFQCLETLYLGFLEESECRDMVVNLGRAMGLTFEPAAVRRVFRASAGHPFLARHLCSFVARRRPQDGVITEGMVSAAERDFLLLGGEGSATLNEITERIQDDYPEEMTLLRDIACNRPDAVAGRRNTQNGSTTRHLLDYGLVESRAGRLTIRPDLVRRQLAGANHGQPPPPPRAPARGGSRPQALPPRRPSPRPGHRSRYE